MKYVSKTSKNAIQNEVDTIIKDTITNLNTTEITDILNKNNLDPSIFSKINDMNTKIFDTPSEDVKRNNNKIIIATSSVIIFLILSFIVISVISYFSYGKCIDVKKIFVENTIIFLFVGLIEFFFFKYIISKYLPVQPSYVLTSITSKLKTNI